MNNILKYTILLGAVAALATSCIKEEFPTDVVTTDQIGSSSAGMEAAVNSTNAWLTRTRVRSRRTATSVIPASAWASTP